MFIKVYSLKNCGGGYDDISAVIHLGACSSTVESDFDYLWNNNVEYSKTLWKYCTEKQITFLYASSAATYGDGMQGFDDMADIDRLLPLNGYGYSKQAFDRWVKKQRETPLHYAGFKFFNVYGPNEYFKGSMASMVFHGYRQVCENGTIRLFRSCKPEYGDGEQLRDFVYVKDVCDVMVYVLEHQEVNGLFNVGTGKAQSFRELAEAVFHAIGTEPRIEYIEMPEKLRKNYQYYTKAETDKLRKAGYTKGFHDLEMGVGDYMCNYLSNDFAIY
ncbi:MAG: ADP-glyceromanno-heptose 6-epimerase [Lachnospiraceae bacterium]|nr:ADP-glyceromanno-heptose 6-epimerase [Butyrivibrio sp.]MCM1343395.1 ADP-glyceromanno-heptose 6-epimerase [Muribaculaceae bacterium]MCM1410564.1 ADP-glyceromanno-heptose 6-epimerase [Lachnospiraceae bacterium]